MQTWFKNKIRKIFRFFLILLFIVVSCLPC